MGDFAIYCNVTDSSFSLSPDFATAVENPLQQTQGLDILVDVFFVQPTGNPAAPWTYLDPVAYTMPQICIAQTNQSVPPYLAQALNPTYVGGSQPYLQFLLSLNTQSIATALGSSPSLKAVFEIDWVNGTRQLIIQCAILISRSVLISANPPPIPPSSYYTQAQINAIIAALFDEASESVSSTGSDTPTIPIYCKNFTYTVTANSGIGSYSHTVNLSSSNRVPGDKACVIIQMPNSTNPTVIIDNNAGSPIWTEVAGGLAYTRQLWFTFGTDWTSDQ